MPSRRHAKKIPANCQEPEGRRLETLPRLGRDTAVRADRYNHRGHDIPPRRHHNHHHNLHSAAAATVVSPITTSR